MQLRQELYDLIWNWAVRTEPSLVKWNAPPSDVAAEAVESVRVLVALPKLPVIVPSMYSTSASERFEKRSWDSAVRLPSISKFTAEGTSGVLTWIFPAGIRLKLTKRCFVS